MEENLPPPQVPVVPVPPAEPPPPKSFPLKWIIIIALLAGIVLSGAYLIFKSQSAKQIPVQTSQTYTQTTPTPIPDETISWKIYENTNADYGFSLKYPSVWRRSDTSDQEIEREKEISLIPSNLLVISDLSDITSLDKSFGDGIRIIVYKNTNNLTSDQFVKSEAFKDDLPGWNNSTKGKSYTLTGLTITRVDEVVGGKGNIGSAVFIPKNGFIIEIESLSSSETNQKIYDQILSTFKFIDSSPSPTCRPRPACLDAKPPCLIPETADMCPPAER